MAIDSKIPSLTPSELAERLREHPELQGRIEEYLDVVDNSNGDVTKADEAEHRLGELMRQMGQSWAERKRVKVESESEGRSDLARREKKGSIGTRRSGK